MSEEFERLRSEVLLRMAREREIETKTVAPTGQKDLYLKMTRCYRAAIQRSRNLVQ